MKASSNSCAPQARRVPRQATSVVTKGEVQERDTRPLEAWRDVAAYVLLGDPGAGKSVCFAEESRLGGGCTVSARDVMDGVAAHVEPGTRVFIDGLDEIRVGTQDGLTPLGRIRAWLKQQGNPPFRLSCREADWLGDVDRQLLDAVTPGGSVQVLHLEPLTDHDIQTLLRAHQAEVPDPDAFLDNAERLGLRALMGNPLLLDLIIKAEIPLTQATGWTRRDIYQRACEQLAREHSTTHQALKKPKQGATDRLLDDAGLLCAVQLLSGKSRISSGHADTPDAVGLADLPTELVLQDPGATLASKLFTAGAFPRHRTIAEFLAGRALARRIEEGLPLGRVLALMLGFDGKPVEPLKGLFAWLAVHHAPSRHQLLPLDPLGIVLNGDVASLSTEERVQLLRELAAQAANDPWFRRNAWASAPWGVFSSRDMRTHLADLLHDPTRDESHQALIDCVLDALRHGEAMPDLAPALRLWVEDQRADTNNRLGAYQAWKRHQPVETQVEQQRHWLDAFHEGRLTDSEEDHLTSALLTDLYPQHLGPTEVFQYLRPTRRQRGYADHADFWGHALLQQSRSEDFAPLADAWASKPKNLAQQEQDPALNDLATKILGQALQSAGDGTSTQRLYNWLGIPLDKYGSSRLNHVRHEAVNAWLEARPARMKALVAFGYATEAAVPNTVIRFWRAEQHLHGARLPADWLFWLLEQAAQATDMELAKYCFCKVAHSAVTPPTGLHLPSLEQIEQWVALQARHKPFVCRWLKRAWRSNLNDARREIHQQNLTHRAKAAQTRDQSRKHLEPYLPSLSTGSVPHHLLGDLAMAHEGRFADIKGDSPVERLQAFLMCDAPTAATALRTLDKVLERDDLPTAEEVLKTEAKGKYHYIRPAALLAARKSTSTAPEIALHWSQAMVERLVAFHLTGGEETPGWYRTLATQRTDWVAPVFLRYALPKLKAKGTPMITGVSSLDKDEALARAVLPDLLARFPMRASEPARSLLNRHLLPLLPMLEEASIRSLVNKKLASSGLDPLQRVAWLVADLPYRAEAAQDLARWAGKNERRAVALGEALREQGSLKRLGNRLPPDAIAQLIEILAPVTPYNPDWTGGWVTTERYREETLSALLGLLSQTPGTDAHEQLRSLKNSSALSGWQAHVGRSLIDQNNVSREAAFVYAAPVDVARALANTTPATVPDLLTLVIDHLRGIEAQLRGADTFGLRHFWNEAQHPPKPWDENRCRDQIVDLLRPRLQPLDIDVATESRMAKDTRADLLISSLRNGTRLRLPVEVKKEDNAGVWTAWRTQLDRLYTTNPDALGHGLYLVLWFGVSPKPSPNREGPRPQSSKEMEERIRQRIPAADRYRLPVLVLDLSDAKT